MYILCGRCLYANKITALLALFVPYLSLCHALVHTFTSRTSFMPMVPREGMYILIAHSYI